MMVIVSMISNEVSFAGYEVSVGVYDGVTCPIDLVFICMVQLVVKSSNFVSIGFNQSFCDADWLVYDGVTCPIDLVFICIVQQYVLIGFNNSFCDADWLVEVRSCQKVLNSDNIINVGVDEDIFEPSDGVRIRSRQ